MTHIQPRSRLPNRRSCLTFDFEHAGIGYTATIGFYGHGAVGEIFLSCKRVSSAADAGANALGYLCSLLMQHGCSLETIADALPRDNLGRPDSVLGIAIGLLGANPWNEVNAHPEAAE